MGTFFRRYIVPTLSGVLVTSVYSHLGQLGLALGWITTQGFELNKKKVPSSVQHQQIKRLFASYRINRNPLDPHDRATNVLCNLIT